MPVSHAAKLAVPSALLALLIGLPLGPSATAAVLHSQSNSAETHDPAVLFQQGQRALQKNDLDHAASLFHQVLLLDPHSAAAYANLGVVAMRQKKWDQALSDFHRAEKLDPRMSGIRLNIGLVEYKRSNYPAAIPPLASVLREEPDSVQARYLLGLCYSFVDQPADAVRTLEPLWPSMSDQFVYLYVLGVSAFQSGNQALDEKANKRLIEVGGDTPQFHLLMAKAMLNHSDDQRALDELKKVETADPKFPFLHFNLGLAYEHLQDHQKAEEEYRKDIALEPDLAYSHEQLARLLLRDGKEQQALQEFQAALARDHRQPQSHLEVARILLRQGAGNEEQALKELDEAEKYAPKNHSIRSVRGQLLIRMGRKAEGAAELAEAKKLFASGLAHEQQEMKEHLVIPAPELTQEP